MEASVSLVQVIWIDACHARDRKDAKPLKVMSFGLLLSDSKEGVVLATSQTEFAEFTDCLFIPKGCVVEITEVPLPYGKGAL